MFECTTWISLPLKIKGQNSEISWIRLAKYDYDPGLQVGDEVDIQNLELGYWGERPFSFKAMVVKRRKIIKPNEEKGDAFELAILLELADKEEFQRMRKILKELNPDKFIDDEPDLES